MLGNTYDAQVCSVARALEAVGERWSLLIVRDALFAGVSRFNDFQHNLGLATNVLKARLDSLVAVGVMQRRRYSERPVRHEYVLTQKGRDLAPALIALTAWGDRWSSPDGPPILYRHAACDGSVRQELACSNCGAIDPSDVVVRPGPGMPADYLASRRRLTDAGRSRSASSDVRSVVNNNR